MSEQESRTPDREGLIEKLEAAAHTEVFHGRGAQRSIALDKAIKIIRQHKAATLQSDASDFTMATGKLNNDRPGEIPVVDKDLLKIGIVDRLGRTIGRGFHEQADVILDALRPYLSTAKPASLTKLRDELDTIASASLKGQGVAGRLQAIISRIDEGKYAD